MTNESVTRRLLAQALGSTLLAATVVGAGVMAEPLRAEMRTLPTKLLQ